MKVVLAIACLLSSGAVAAQDLAVMAVIRALPYADFAPMIDPACRATSSGGNVVICMGGWTRHALSQVSTLDGTALPDAVALVFTDPRIDGPKLLVLEPLSPADVQLYGAQYKAKEVAGLFSAACPRSALSIAPAQSVSGPFSIEGIGETCYLFPNWWAR